MGVFDRVKASFVALARGAHPTIDYLAHYRARVLKQHANLRRIDIQPDDRRLPVMANIPLRIGVPGVDVTLAPGHLILVGWENGRPDHPYASLWEPGEQGTKPLKVTLHASIIELGGKNLNPVIDGLVRASTPCQFSGLPHFAAGKTSQAVMAKET